MVKRFRVNHGAIHRDWPPGEMDMVTAADYDAAIDALRLLFKEMELSGNLGSKDYGWPKAITASRAILDAQSERRDEHG